MRVQFGGQQNKIRQSKLEEHPNDLMPNTVTAYLSFPGYPNVECYFSLFANTANTKA